MAMKLMDSASFKGDRWPTGLRMAKWSKAPDLSFGLREKAMAEWSKAPDSSSGLREKAWD
ncbi:hypothetical protein CR513_17976, partial [Mucuna pruriens]